MCIVGIWVLSWSNYKPCLMRLCVYRRFMAFLAVETQVLLNRKKKKISWEKRKKTQTTLKGWCLYNSILLDMIHIYEIVEPLGSLSKRAANRSPYLVLSHIIMKKYMKYRKYRKCRKHNTISTNSKVSLLGLILIFLFILRVLL